MKYLKLFNENMGAAKAVISRKMEAFDKLKVLLSKNMGLIGKFTEYLMDENISYNDLESLYKKLQEIKSKGYPLDFQKMKYERTIDKIRKIEDDISVKGLINKFPSLQKNIAKENLEKPSFYNALLQTSKKGNVDTFVSKISRYKDLDGLVNALSLFGKNGMNDRTEVEEYVKSSKKSDIVLSTDDILIVRVYQIGDIQKLGSDTSWCILGSGMWTTYTKDRYQFIIYDFRKGEFDPKFKIGFTLSKDGRIYAAHDILDKSSREYLESIVNEFNVNLSSLIIKQESKVDISSLNSKTLLRVWKEVAESCLDDQILEVIQKLITVSKLRISEKGNVLIDRDLTDGKFDTLKALIKRYFESNDYVLVKDLNDISPVLVPLQLKRPLVSRHKFINPDFANFDAPLKIIPIALDIWTDKAILENSSIILTYTTSVTSKGIDLKWSKEDTLKLSNRLNKIFEKVKENRSLTESMVILNYLLGRKELVSKDVLDLISPIVKTNYILLFNEPIDLDKLGNIYTLPKGYEWVKNIIKKDYEKPFYLPYNEMGSRNILSEIIKHLDGYKIIFKVSRTKLNYINHDDSKEGKIVASILRKFRARPKSGDVASSDDGNISIIIS